VGWHLCWLAKTEFEVCYTYFKNPVQIEGSQGFALDITDRERVINLVNSVSPGIIYHTAYDRTNLWPSIVDGTTNLVNAFKMLQEKFGEEKRNPLPKFFFLSTDAVFDGGKGNYYEQDIPLPIWGYGEAKLKAEEMVLSNSGTVVRTSLVYGIDPLDSRTRDLFFGLRGEKPLISYFDDEYRCPIYVSDLCNVLLELSKIDSPSVLHVAGPKRLSRYEFAIQLGEAMGF
jgi:dTDP-4-dehydrorhamnose reductase